VKSAFTAKSRTSEGDVLFTVKNNCGNDILPGFWTSNPPLNGGALLSSGQSVSFSLPAGISGQELIVKIMVNLNVKLAIVAHQLNVFVELVKQQLFLLNFF